MDWKGGYKNSAFYSTFGFGFSPGCHGVSWRSAGTYIELLQSQLTKHNSINMECDYGQ
jgi:hypothetical protein